MTPHGGSDVVVVEATPAHRSSVFELLCPALGWNADEWHRGLFAWKHEQNPFGRSFSWVAEADGTIVGFRAFMQWEFESPEGLVRAARAVDTVTHQAYRGRGIFRQLTTHALEELPRRDVEFVFNTPNDLSRPGYLGMGWKVVGRLTPYVRPSSARGISRMARSRAPASLRSEPSTAGAQPAAILSDGRAIEELINSQPPPRALRTRRSLPFLRWRYGNALLGFRAVCLGDGPAGGVAFFRLRRRGAAREAIIGDVLAPEDNRRARRELLRRVARVAGSDYTLTFGACSVRTMYFPLLRVGPVLTSRELRGNAVPGLRSWQLVGGDVEMF